jgi:hypothetical protein
MSTLAPESLPNSQSLIPNPQSLIPNRHLLEKNVETQNLSQRVAEPVRCAGSLRQRVAYFPPAICDCRRAICTWREVPGVVATGVASLQGFWLTHN